MSDDEPDDDIPPDTPLIAAFTVMSGLVRTGDGALDLTEEFGQRMARHLGNLDIPAVWQRTGITGMLSADFADLKAGVLLRLAGDVVTAGSGNSGRCRAMMPPRGRRSLSYTITWSNLSSPGRRLRTWTLLFRSSETFRAFAVRGSVRGEPALTNVDLLARQIECRKRVRVRTT